ncbi:MAG: ABC transporter ATP-binding protein [Candidatus Bipolaricaulaceae bacterium]
MKVRLVNVSAGYGRTNVLEGVELELSAGEVLGIIGPNGAGKTTLLRAMAGALRPSCGVVYLDGQKLGRFKPRDLARLLGVVPQVPSSGFDFRVRELVELGRLPHLRPPDRLSPQDQAAVARALRLADLEHLASRPISSLSGGERQRVFLAMALAQEPEVLLLDEPTAHLDVRYRLEFLTLVRRLAREGMAVAMAIHDLNLACCFSDRLLLLSQGRVLAQGRPEEVLVPELLRQAFGLEALVLTHPISGRPWVEFRLP